MSDILRCFFVLGLFFVNFVCTTLTQAGHVYMLSNEYSGTNNFKYFAWTDDPNVAYEAASANPGVYMMKVLEEQLLADQTGHVYWGWLFDSSNDGTCYIYAANNNYDGVETRRLSIKPDGITPFLEGSADNAQQQVWRLEPSDNNNHAFAVANDLTKGVLDINGGGVGVNTSNYPIDGIFMGDWGSTKDGQHWHLVDITPTINVTATVYITMTSTIFTSMINTPTTSSSVVGLMTDLPVSTTDSAIKPYSKRTLPMILTMTNTVATTSVTTYVYSTFSTTEAGGSFPTTIFSIVKSVESSAVTSSATTTSNTPQSSNSLPSNASTTRASDQPLASPTASSPSGGGLSSGVIGLIASLASIGSCIIAFIMAWYSCHRRRLLKISEAEVASIETFNV